MNDKTIKILLIEDNAGDIRLIREMLTEAKYIAFDLECVDRLSTGLERNARGDIDIYCWISGCRIVKDSIHSTRSMTKPRKCQ
jgi:CheY-like chemotaxis protein